MTASRALADFAASLSAETIPEETAEAATLLAVAPPDELGAENDAKPANRHGVRPRVPAHVVRLARSVGQKSEPIWTSP